MIAAAATMISSWALAAQVTNDGQVVKVDQAKGTVTIEHGPQGTTGSAAPKRTFVYEYKVPNAAVLNTLKVGDKVHFTAEDTGGQIWTATTIQKQ